MYHIFYHMYTSNTGLVLHITNSFICLIYCTKCSRNNSIRLFNSMIYVICNSQMFWRKTYRSWVLQENHAVVMTLKFRRRFHSIPRHRRRFAGFCRSPRVSDPFNYVAFSIFFPPSGVHELLVDAAAMKLKN